MFHWRRAIALPVIGGLFLGSNLLADRARDARKEWPPEENYVTLPSSQVAPWVYMGYRELAADITWVRMLVYFGSGFLGEHDFRYLKRFVDNVIELDPNFERVYLWAAYSITIREGAKVSTVQEDYRASLDILERGMAQYPDKYEYFWLAGTTYFMDMRSDDPEEQRAFKEKGAELIEEAMHKPDAPHDLASTAAALRSKLGQQERAIDNLRQMILTTDDPKAQAKLLASLEALMGDASIRDELEKAAASFDSLRRRELPLVPADIFILQGGPARSQVIDLEELGAPRDLLGLYEEDDRELDPAREFFPR